MNPRDALKQWSDRLYAEQVKAREALENEADLSRCRVCGSLPSSKPCGSFPRVVEQAK